MLYELAQNNAHRENVCRPIFTLVALCFACDRLQVELAKFNPSLSSTQCPPLALYILYNNCIIMQTIRDALHTQVQLKYASKKAHSAIVMRTTTAAMSMWHCSIFAPKNVCVCVCSHIDRGQKLQPQPLRTFLCRLNTYMHFCVVATSFYPHEDDERRIMCHSNQVIFYA